MKYSRIQDLIIVICFGQHMVWSLTEDGEDNLFTYADGWNLDELHENIREAIREHCIVFEDEAEVSK